MPGPRPRVLYASFDAVPAPKGAAVHIRQTVGAVAAVADVDLLTLPGTLAEPEEWPSGVRADPFSPPEGNFLHRALEWGDHVARRLLERTYDVVHVRSIWEGTPALLLQPERGYRLIYEANGLPSVELKYHYPAVGSDHDLLGRLRAQERALLRGADRVMTQSHTTRKFLRGHGAADERLRVIPNGVDGSRFRPTPLPRDEEPVIAYVGTLAPWQGVGFLLEAVAQVREARPVRVEIAGPARKEWLRDLQRRAERLGLGEAARFLGPLAPAEVTAFLARATVCAAPLLVTDRNVNQGCCPLKVLEYLASGRPVVAARLPAVAELITHEETGLLYKPDKPRRLAEALLRLLEDRPLAERLAAAGATAAREGFSWERHNRAVRELYAELIS
jgi:glycosyltransferase involved in cell wall biosynthesis